MFRTYLLLQWFCAAEAFDLGNRHVAEPGAFKADGAGAIVNSSRGITACFKPDEPRWEAAIENATRSAIAQLAAVTPAVK